MTRYRTTEKAEQAGRQTAFRVVYGLGGKYFPDFRRSLSESIASAKESQARVARIGDQLLVAYWCGYIAEMERVLGELK